MGNTAIGIDIENELLCHLAVKESVEYMLKEGLTNNLIHSPQLKSVLNFVEHHFNDTGKVPTIAVLQHEYPNVDFDPPQTTIEYVIDKLKFRYRKNELQDLTVELAKLNEDPDTAMRFLQGEVFRIEKNTLSQQHTYSNSDYPVFINTVQEKMLQGNYVGATIGFKDIDDFTGGIKNGNVAYIMARPKRKKSFFMLQAFIEQAKAGLKPYLFTLELGPEEVMLRIACMISGVSWDDAQKGALMVGDWQKIKKAFSDFEKYEW